MPAGHRFYLPPEQWASDELRLTGDEAHHCSRVFRHKAGDVVEIFDGCGRSRRVVIADATSKEVRLEIEAELPIQPSPYFVTLGQAILKGKTMDLIVQKAVELGVRKIVPFVSEHSLVRPYDGKDFSAKWRRVALEACKQCGQNWLPEVSAPQSISYWKEEDESELNLVAALTPEARTLRDVLKGEGSPRSASLLIGPEGDFTEHELAELQEAGYHPITLGPLILRAETAAISALSILSYEMALSV